MLKRLCLLLLLLAATGARAATLADADPEQVQTRDLAVGQGRPVATGAFAVIRYTAWLFDPAAPEGRGREFDSSAGHGGSITFVYGYGRGLRGLEKGMAGMLTGGRRLIYVPGRLGYDDLKYPTPPDVPPGSALLFDVELRDVVPQGAPES